MREISQDQPMLCSSADLGSPSMIASGRKLRIKVLGNGDQITPAAPIADVHVLFNNTRPRQITSAFIGAATERAPADRTPSLVLKSDLPDFALLTNALKAQAKDQLALQIERLGCLPSTGFMVVHALWDSQHHVWVDGMNFDPTLERPLVLPSRKPLPQMFHNWLGERRLGLSRWLSAPPQNWKWPLTSMQAQQGNESQEPGGDIQHIEILGALLEAQQSRSLARLVPMLEFPVMPSERLLQDVSETRRLEGFFHLQRHLNETPNWWLYDHAGSVLINQLAQRLRSAQRRTFLALSMDARLAD